MWLDAIVVETRSVGKHVCIVVLEPFQSQLDGEK